MSLRSLNLLDKRKPRWFRFSLRIDIDINLPLPFLQSHLFFPLHYIALSSGDRTVEHISNHHMNIARVYVIQLRVTSIVAELLLSF